MLMEVKKHIRLMFLSFKYNLTKAMENRISFIVQVLFMMLNNATFIIQWVILFQIKDNIGGYSFQDVLVLWGLSSSSFGISHVFFYNVISLPELITNGKLDVYLTQPKNVLVNLAVSNMETSAIGDLLYGYVVVMIVRPGISTFLLFTLFAILGGILLTSFLIIVGSFTFWMKKGDVLSHQLFSLMVNFATYPEGIFKGVARMILFTILPVGFMVYIPVRILSEFNIVLCFIVIAFTVMITLLAFLIFHIGLKRYSSSNLMSARV